MSFISDVEGVESEDKKELNPTEVQELKESRQIVREILDFGINQNQILQILGLMALELENRDLMLKLVSSIREAQSELYPSKLSF
jgi:hypothetical protein